MLATTAVNECLLCARFHSEMAFQSGVDRREVAALLNMDLSGKTTEDDELNALLFAQHFAETNRNPSPEMRQRLFDYYGDKKGADIILIIRLITFGNLSGNTFSAFQNRLKGIKAEKSSVIFEIFFVIFTAPLIIPSLIYIKLKKNHFQFSKSVNQN